MKKKPINNERAERAIAEFVEALGYDDPVFTGTPERVVSAWTDELLVGENIDLGEVIAKGSERAESTQPIGLSGIEINTICPHHLMIARGTADVLFIPDGTLLGLGTLAKVALGAAARMSLQEDIAPRICSALMEHAHAKGAFCRISLDHTCLQSRGPKQRHAQAISWHGTGSLSDTTAALTLLSQLKDES